MIDMHTPESRIDNALAAIGNEVGTDAATRNLIGELALATKEWFQVFARSPGADLTPPMDAFMEIIWPRQPIDTFLGDRPEWRKPASMRTARWYWSEHFRLLRDYAQDGQIWPGEYDGLGNGDISALPQLYGEAEAFLLNVPKAWLRDEQLMAAYHAMWIVLGKARGRSRLDSGEDLSFFEVVLLSGMAPKSVRNATQERHGAGRLIVGDQDIVANGNATSWLRDRRTFTPTPNSKADIEGPASVEGEEFVFVPLDEAGREFDPETALQSPPGPSYTYVVDGDDRYTNKYMDALADLQSAKRGQWLFSNGEWGTAQCWQRVSKAGLRRKEKNTNEQRRLMCAEYDESNRATIAHWSKLENE